MKTLFDRRSLGGKAARASALCLLALAAMLCQSREARAQWTTSGTNNTTTGNVGVGTTAPQTSVHVSTSTTSFVRGIINEQASADSNSALFFFRKSRAGAAVQNGDNLGSLFASPFDGANFVNSARLRFAVDGAVAPGSVPTAIQFMTGASADGAERMRISSAGNVGIGTMSPTQALHVMGKGLIQNTGTASSLITDRTDGKIAAIGAGGVSSTFAYDNTGVFKIESNTRANIMAGNFGSGATTRLAIDAAGNVGVGTEAPASKLHVVGDITVTGNINAKYQDVAEWVPSTQKLAAGTVVVLDTGRDNHVLASHSAYDTRVAGVVSAQPGLTLGEKGENKALVATTGRVKVKVDATRGAIQIGDLIVTGDAEGVAMKSQPVSFGGVAMHRPGTIIGKALESLEKGTGEILVLLSLQ